jgi:hypothetical protein
MKIEAFDNLPVFYRSIDAGEVPQFVRSLGEVVQRTGRDENPDYGEIRGIFAGHGIQGPIDFQALQVKLIFPVGVLNICFSL